MNYILIIIQAAVQGLTEFLPVSSSGHLSVLQHIMGVGEESLTISIVLHLGTLVSVFIAFWPTVLGMLKEFFFTLGDVFTGKFSWSKMNGMRRMMFMVIIATAVLLPAYPFKDYFTGVEGDGDIVFEGCAFILTAIFLFLSDACAAGYKTDKNIKITDAVTVGLFQVVALFPGVSRSGSTISSSLFCGLSRETAVTFSFMMGIPAILGGGVMQIKEAVETGVVLNYTELLIGFAVSAIVGFWAIKLVKMLIKKEKMKIFGVYTVILGLACVTVGAIEHITGWKFIIVG
ncbi:MAG: undecaprenyl-diphosphate phosphatase [Eubacterium sp.]|nr:undecaprenyl-diphosphate phosphatase [Eubacterium sp.]